MFAKFPEVTQVVSQVGRPDDGTDSTGFFNTEYFIDLKPREQWRPQFHEDKEQLIAALDTEVEKIPGVIWNFSQPIADNMEEAVSGVKGELAVKIYGDRSEDCSKHKADEIVGVMSKVRGVQDLGIFRVIGQPNLNLMVNRDKADRFGINVSDVQDAIETAVGRQGGEPGAEGRGALRPGGALSAAIPHAPWSEIENIRHAGARPASACRSASSATSTMKDGASDDLPRRELALRRHQVQRARPRPGQHGGGSDARR